MPSKRQLREIETSWGSVSLALENGKVVDCTLPRLDGTPAIPFRVLRHGTDRASAFVAAALAGRRRKVPDVAFLVGTPFQRAVWKAIGEIPPGETRSYAELACATGRPKAFRAAAQACGANPVPLFIPCHRVVGSSGQLGGFSSGLAWKRLLLAAEGRAV